MNTDLPWRHPANVPSSREPAWAMLDGELIRESLAIPVWLLREDGAVVDGEFHYDDATWREPFGDALKIKGWLPRSVFKA